MWITNQITWFSQSIMGNKHTCIIIQSKNASSLISFELITKMFHYHLYFELLVKQAWITTQTGFSCLPRRTWAIDKRLLICYIFFLLHQTSAGQMIDSAGDYLPDKTAVNRSFNNSCTSKPLICCFQPFFTKTPNQRWVRAIEWFPRLNTPHCTLQG